MNYKSFLRLSVAVGVFLPLSAWAQEAAQAAPAQATADQAEPAPTGDIVVTGTRLILNGAQAPTPVSVITSAEIARSAPVTIADYVNQLPALSGSSTPRTPQSSVGAATGGANLLNLRNLGPNRTLVLLDGRRTTPSFLTGVVDINTLPTALIKRVDVVTGGASASYGSDAVSGVVNFVLDTKFTGLTGNIQSGISTEGDSASYTASLSGGTGFANGRGHLILSGTYTKQEPAFLDGRSWYKGYKIFANPAFAAGNGQPARLILPNTTLNTTNYGLIGSGPLRGTAFDANGNVATTNFPFGPITSGFFQSGGTANDDNSLGQVVQLGTGLEQGSVYGRASFDITDNLSIFGEGSYGKTKSSNQSGLFWRVGTATIQTDNAYLPDSVRTAAAAAGVTSFPFSTNNRDIGIATGYYTRDVLRLLTGIEGKIGGRWKWSASYQYGKATSTNNVVQDIKPGNYNLAIDAVVNPANGQIVCRSTLTAPTNGCVPYNPFGSRPLTAAQTGYLIGTSSQDLTYRQDVAEASIQGPLFTLPAGEVSLAVGGEYRREKAFATSDAASIANQFYVGNFKPFQGNFNVNEFFAELAVPVLRDSAVGKSLSLNGAFRTTHYSTSGRANTWKVGAVYKPIDDITLRVTRSRDIRAPNLSDLFQGGTFAQQTINNPFRGNINDQFNQITAGNPALKPEIASSLTGGIVIQPRAVPGLTLSVDYYDLKIKGSIAALSAQLIVNQCFAGVQSYCSVITGAPATDITSIQVLPFNARTERARGIDIEASYSRPLGSGTIDFRGLVNYANKLEISSPAGVITRAGEVGTNLGAASGVPRFTGLASVTYTRDPVTFQLKGRFLSASKVEQDYGPLDVNAERNHVPAIVYLDAFVGFDVKAGGTSFQVFFAGDNILDKAPPIAVSQDNTNTQTPGTNVFLYDVIGRTLRAGVKFKL